MAATMTTPPSLPPTSPQQAAARSRLAIGHQDAFAAVWNASTRLYRSIADEAYRDEPAQARKMLLDAGIRSLLAERILPSTSLQLQVMPDDPDDRAQSAVAERYTKLIEATPRLGSLKRYLQLSTFYGRYGSQVGTGWTMVDGRRMAGIVEHQPWSGDKINFDWDGVPAVLVRTTYQPPRRGDAEFRFSDKGGGKFLMLDRPYWRDRFIIQEADPIDRDFLAESDMAGQVHGEGLRSLLYWPWYIREQLKAWALDAIQRIGTNGMLYAYCESGNEADMEAVLEALSNLITNNIAVFKRINGVDQQGILNIPPSPVAYEVIRAMIDYFDDQIRMLIVGQTLSSDTGSTGMGSGVAEFHRSTKEALVRVDIDRLGDTFTTDVLRPLIRVNGERFPFGMRVTFLLDREDGLEVLQKAQLAQQIGLLLDEEDIRTKAGLKRPADAAHALRPPSSQGPGGPTPDSPDSPSPGARPAPGPPAPASPRPPVAGYADDDPGVMVALYPPPALARELSVPGGEPPDRIHCTLAYLGRRSEVGTGHLPGLHAAVALVAKSASPLEGTIGGTGRFPASASSDGLGVLYAGVGVPGLAEFRQALVAVLDEHGFPYRKDHGFCPHVTLDYVDPRDAAPAGVLESRPVRFTSVSLVVGDERWDFGLGTPLARYAAEHAPEGGTDADGKHYKGGQFVPSKAPHHRRVDYRDVPRAGKSNPGGESVDLDEGSPETAREARVLTRWQVGGEPVALVVRDPRRADALAARGDDEDEVAEARSLPYSVLTPWGDGHDTHGHYATRAEAESEARGLAAEARRGGAESGSAVVPAGEPLEDHLPAHDPATHERRLRAGVPSRAELEYLAAVDRDEFLLSTDRSGFADRQSYLDAMKRHVESRLPPGSRTRRRDGGDPDAGHASPAPDPAPARAPAPVPSHEATYALDTLRDLRQRAARMDPAAVVRMVRGLTRLDEPDLAAVYAGLVGGPTTTRRGMAQAIRESVLAGPEP